MISVCAPESAFRMKAGFSFAGEAHEATGKRSPGSNHQIPTREAFMQERDWKRVVMIGSFAAAAVLVFTGKRSAAFAAAGIGLATLASDHPDKLQMFWDAAPGYIEKGSRLVNEVGGLVEKIAEKGSRIQSFRQGARPSADYLT
ncbi:MAG: hypothetical protein ABIP81_04545 [Terriglobales bacterium]